MASMFTDRHKPKQDFDLLFEQRPFEEQWHEVMRFTCACGIHVVINVAGTHVFTAINCPSCLKSIIGESFQVGLL